MYRNYRHNNCGCNNIKKCDNNCNAPALATQNFERECGDSSIMIMQDLPCNYDCSCGFYEYDGMPEFPQLGQCYVPIQKLNQTYDSCMGLQMGTIFPELVRPYVPYQSIEQSAFIESMNQIREGCNNDMRL